MTSRSVLLFLRFQTAHKPLLVKQTYLLATRLRRACVAPPRRTAGLRARILHEPHALTSRTGPWTGWRRRARAAAPRPAPARCLAWTQSRAAAPKGPARPRSGSICWLTRRARAQAPARRARSLRPRRPRLPAPAPPPPPCARRCHNRRAARPLRQGPQGRRRQRCPRPHAPRPGLRGAEDAQLPRPWPCGRLQHPQAHPQRARHQGPAPARPRRRRPRCRPAALRSRARASAPAARWSCPGSHLQGATR